MSESAVQESSTQPTTPQEYSGDEADRVWPGAYHTFFHLLIQVLQLGGAHAGRWICGESAVLGVCIDLTAEWLLVFTWYVGQNVACLRVNLEIIAACHVQLPSQLILCVFLIKLRYFSDLCSLNMIMQKLFDSEFRPPASWWRHVVVTFYASAQPTHTLSSVFRSSCRYDNTTTTTPYIRLMSCHLDDLVSAEHTSNASLQGICRCRCCHATTQHGSLSVGSINEQLYVP